MLKRNLSLEETWRKCLKMWKEMIEKHWERGMTGEELKTIYFQKHPRLKRPENDCYFCEYQIQREDEERDDSNICSLCPAVMINKMFNCMISSYNYHHHPKVFYRKLLELNKKR